MGDQRIKSRLEGEARRSFMRQLLDDLRALEKILAGDLIETGVRRIGAEQEMFLVDENWRPAPAAMEILAELDDPSFTNELRSTSIPTSSATPA
jgi:hypothetical protein